jgi:hypothetical protein
MTAVSLVFTVSTLSLCVAGEQAQPTKNIHQAAFDGDVNQISLNIAAGANVDALDSYHRTPLLCAIDAGQTAAVRELLDARANPDFRGARDVPLIAAVLRGHDDIVKMLLDAGVQVDATDSFGATALFGAVEMGRKAIVEMLIEKGANVNAEVAGRTVLGLADQTQQTEIAHLLKDRGAAAAAPEPARAHGLYSIPTAPGLDVPQNQAVIPAGLPADVNQAILTALLSDPNAVFARLASVPDVCDTVMKIDEKARTGERSWQLRSIDNRGTLARMMERQFTEEMDAVHKFADEEHATNTAKAIDDLIAKRDAQYKAIAQELRQQRMASVTETGTRGGRGGRGGATGGGRGGRGGNQMAVEPMPTQESQLDQELQNQIQPWLSADYEDKRDLLTAVHNTDLQEYVGLDELARRERASKTSLALESLIVLHQQRIDRIMARMAQDDERIQRREERANQTETGRGGRGSTRGGR